MHSRTELRLPEDSHAKADYLPVGRDGFRLDIASLAQHAVVADQCAFAERIGAFDRQAGNALADPAVGDRLSVEDTPVAVCLEVGVEIE